MMTNYMDLDASQIAALRQIFDVLSAYHAPPFAAEFLDEFWQQIFAIVSKSEATQ